MAERKRYPRLRTLKRGKIVFDRRSCVIDCTVRNISATGAALEVASAVGIPDEFTLVIEGLRRACHVAWRKSGRIGVKFV